MLQQKYSYCKGNGFLTVLFFKHLINIDVFLNINSYRNLQKSDFYLKYTFFFNS
jgi:hypothetical protein